MVRVFSLAACLLLGACQFLAAAAEAHQREVTLKAGQYSLHGCYSLPEGPGPFPVIIHNHGSDKNPPPCGPPDLVKFYVRHGYAFFTVQRHGHGASQGDYILDVQRKIVVLNALNKQTTMREIIALHEQYNRDVEGGVAWLKTQKWANVNRLAMTGVAYGGIQTLLAAEKGLGIKAFLAFSPAGQAWNLALGNRLIQAVERAKAPLFVIQAQNDFVLEPCHKFGPQLKPPSKAKIYPPFGDSSRDASTLFGTREAGIAIWGHEVLAFLSAVME
jgi:dienelactone hydrolase